MCMWRAISLIHVGIYLYWGSIVEAFAGKSFIMKMNSKYIFIFVHIAITASEIEKIPFRTCVMTLQ